jgi:hypothetical protein
VGGDLDVAALVVDPALLPPVNAADGGPIRLIEERDRLVVLALSVLDHELVLGVVGVNGQALSALLRIRVPGEPLELVLSQGLLAQELVADIEDVGRIAVARGSRSRAAGSLLGHGTTRRPGARRVDLLGCQLLCCAAQLGRPGEVPAEPLPQRLGLDAQLPWRAL